MAEKRATFILRRFFSLGFSKWRWFRTSFKVPSRSMRFFKRRNAFSTDSPFFNLISVKLIHFLPDRSGHEATPAWRNRPFRARDGDGRRNASRCQSAIFELFAGVGLVGGFCLTTESTERKKQKTISRGKAEPFQLPITNLQLPFTNLFPLLLCGLCVLCGENWGCAARIDTHTYLFTKWAVWVTFWGNHWTTAFRGAR